MVGEGKLNHAELGENLQLEEYSKDQRLERDFLRERELSLPAQSSSRGKSLKLWGLKSLG